MQPRGGGGIDLVRGHRLDLGPQPVEVVVRVAVDHQVADARRDRAGAGEVDREDAGTKAAGLVELVVR